MSLWDEIDESAVLEFAMWAAIGFVGVRLFRGMTATDAGGAVFQSTAPALAPLQSAVDILVPMSVSPAGLQFIENEENFSPTVTNDAGHPMFGFGHDLSQSDAEVARKSGQRLTRAQGVAILKTDLANVAGALNAALKVPVSQDQFDALASWTLNVGNKAMQDSTLMRKLNAGDYAGAAAEFSRWNKSQGSTNNGLTARRGREQGLFNSGNTYG